MPRYRPIHRTHHMIAGTCIGCGAEGPPEGEPPSEAAYRICADAATSEGYKDSIADALTLRAAQLRQAQESLVSTKHGPVLGDRIARLKAAATSLRSTR